MRVRFPRSYHLYGAWILCGTPGRRPEQGPLAWPCFVVPYYKQYLRLWGYGKLKFIICSTEVGSESYDISNLIDVLRINLSS